MSILVRYFSMQLLNIAILKLCNLKIIARLLMAQYIQAMRLLLLSSYGIGLIVQKAKPVIQHEKTGLTVLEIVVGHWTFSDQN